MRLVFAAVLLLSTAPAFAIDAVTYSGTLGDHDIVVELTDPTGSVVAGRYSYLDKGADIPLDAASTEEGVITLAEEAPCTDETCVEDENSEIAKIPVAANWQLKLLEDGSIAGGWNPVADGKALDIKLTEIGRRALPDGTELDVGGLIDSAATIRFESTDNLSADNAPYEFTKLDIPYEQGAEMTLDGSKYRLDIDPRSKFKFPTIVALADGSSPELANATLRSRHGGISLNAFDCLSKVYAGTGFRPGFGGGEPSLGDYDGEAIDLVYLSPTVTGWTEAGSTFCGGAYPNNHFDSYIMDTKTGEPLALGKIFKDWTAVTDYTTYEDATDQAAALADPANYGWSAGQPLIDYVEANREIFDAETEKECGMSDLVASNLDMRFEAGDRVVFTITGLPHATFACSNDLLTVKLADIPQLLAPTAKDFFPSLAK